MNLIIDDPPVITDMNMGNFVPREIDIVIVLQREDLTAFVARMDHRGNAIIDNDVGYLLSDPRTLVLGRQHVFWTRETIHRDPVFKR